MHTMPIVQSDNANCAIRQCQICTQCQLCNQTIPNMHTMPIMQSDNAKYACNANCVSQTMPIMQTMPIVLLDNVNRATRQCHNRQWTMPNMHTMQIVQHIWHWIAAYLALYGCTIGIMCLYNMVGHSWDARSGLVTRVTLGLVWSLGWRLVWFGHLGDAWSGLVTQEAFVWFDTLGWCQRLRDDNFQNIVWFRLLRRCCLIWPTRGTRCPSDITQET